MNKAIEEKAREEGLKYQPRHRHYVERGFIEGASFVRQQVEAEGKKPNPVVKDMLADYGAVQMAIQDTDECRSAKPRATTAEVVRAIVKRLATLEAEKERLQSENLSLRKQMEGAVEAIELVDSNGKHVAWYPASERIGTPSVGREIDVLIIRKDQP